MFKLYIYVGSPNATITHQVESHIKSSKAMFENSHPLCPKMMLSTKLRKWFRRVHLMVQYFIHVKVGCVKTSHQPHSHILPYNSCYRVCVVKHVLTW